jgi:heme/copper-type cytochrome/quinol oxidase subunit 2
MDQNRGGLQDVAEFYDYLKHLTTLSTASLLFLATFAEKFAKTPHWRFLFKLTIVCLLFAVILSLACMFFTISSKRYEEDDGLPDWEKSAMAATFLLAVMSLLLGILSLAVFALINYA